jgi:hypothetical protein
VNFRVFWVHFLLTLSSIERILCSPSWKREEIEQHSNSSSSLEVQEDGFSMPLRTLLCQPRNRRTPPTWTQAIWLLSLCNGKWFPEDFCTHQLMCAAQGWWDSNHR